MTDTSVGLLGGMINSMNNMPTVTSEKEKKDGICLPEFETVFSNAKNNSLNLKVSDNTKSQSSKKTDNTVNSAFESEKQGKTHDGKKITTKKTVAEKLSKNANDVSEAEQQSVSSMLQEYQVMSKEMILGGLSVTEEELEQALSGLDLSMTDLLDISNLARVFDFFNEESTLADVLMDPQFMETFQGLSELTVDVMNALEIEMEEFVPMLNQQEVVTENTFEFQVIPEEQSVVSVVEDELEENVEGVIAQHSEAEFKETEKMDETLNDETLVEEETNQEVIQGPEMSEDSTETGDETEKDFSEKQSFSVKKDDIFKKDTKDIAHTATHVQHVENIQANMNGVQTIEQSVKIVDLQNLVSEITEYVRMQSTGTELSSIEIQLNPANLGKVLVEVSTNNGEVSTKITTQTEAAKEALEASVTQLRTNLEEQGVKVNAVEITVETHAFEQNLHEGGSKEQQQLARELQQEHQRRNLNLNEMSLEDLQGLMSEEDLVVAKMMRDNGNVINIGA